MTHRTDVARQALTLTSAIAQAALPVLLTPSFPRDEQPPDVMQPAGYTFAAWLPIFATSIAHGIDQARPARSADPVLRSTGWPLAAAYTCTAAWAPLVATRRHWSAQSVLIGVATFGEIARRRLAVADHNGAISTGDRITLLPSAAMLSAWGTAAATVNLTAMLVDRGVAPLPASRRRRNGGHPRRRSALCVHSGRHPRRQPIPRRPRAHRHRTLGAHRHRSRPTTPIARGRVRCPRVRTAPHRDEHATPQTPVKRCGLTCWAPQARTLEPRGPRSA